MDFLDENREEINDVFQIIPIKDRVTVPYHNEPPQYNRITLNAITPPGTLFIRIWVVATGNASVHIDELDIHPFGCEVGIANRPPLIDQPHDQVNLDGTRVELTISATDPEGAPLHHSATNLPDGLHLDSSTGVITGNSVFQEQHVVTVNVSDGESTSSVNFTRTFQSLTDDLPEWPADLVGQVYSICFQLN